MSAGMGSLAAGLPGPLPEGERLLWQGRPEWKSVALRVLHVRKLAIYFAALLAWYVVAKLAGGMPAGRVAIGAAELGGCALATLALLTGYAWGVRRATVYTITNRRVLIKFGVGLSMTINLPFARIDGAAVKQAADGTGDIALTIAPGEHVSYLVLWPHVRSWHLGRTQPALRSLADAASASRVLARALAASAEVSVPAAPVARPKTVGADGRAAAAA
jgi:hypothetical protein